jgi:uncharacterized membrane-anchored protein
MKTLLSFLVVFEIIAAAVPSNLNPVMDAVLSGVCAAAGCWFAYCLGKQDNKNA